MRTNRGTLLRLVLGGYPLPRDLARSAFRRNRLRPALIGPGGTRTYGQLGERVYRLAQGLEMLGVGRGDPLFTLLPDDLEAVETRLAAAEVGAVLVPLSPGLPPGALCRVGALVRPEVLIHDPGLCAGGAAALRASFPRLRPLAVGPGGEYERLLQDQPPRPSGAALQGGDPALLIVTAGPAGFQAAGLREVGEPRGLTFTQQALTAALRLAVLNLDPLPGGPEVLLEAVPLCAGGGWALLPVLFAGGTLVLPGRPDAARLAGLVGRHRVTRALLTPALLADLLDLPARQRAALPGPLRGLLVAGGPLPGGRMEEAARRFGPIVQAAYGLPEIPAPVSLQGPERPEAGTPAGRVVPGVRVRIAGRAGRPVAAGTVGEILVDSPAAFCGYWGRPDLSGWAFRDGGFHTGDQGFLDAEGRLHVLGRRSERIERVGRTLLPPEVEGPALEHPDVKEACLVERDGALTLAVSLRAERGGGEEGADPESLRAFLAERLESWQLPERIAILAALPRDERLQVSRRRVREAVGSPAPARL